MRKGDLVRTAENPTSIPAKVVRILDMGHGKGNEMVEVDLLGLRRFYAKKELKVVQDA